MLLTHTHQIAIEIKFFEIFNLHAFDRSSLNIAFYCSQPF